MVELWDKLEVLNGCSNVCDACILPITIFTNFSIANYINILLLSSCEVQMVHEEEGEGEGEEDRERPKMRQVRHATMRQV